MVNLICKKETLSKYLSLIVLAGCLLASCGSNKELTERAKYFTNVSDSLLRESIVNYETKLKSGDILYIAVNTANEASARLLNQPNFFGASSGTSNSAGSNTIGYLIDEQGYIVFPEIGKIKAAGFTRAEFTDSLTFQLHKFVEDAIVSVRLLNFKVTVLGEVAHAGSFSIPGERITVLDAIGLAGDMTVFARRDNIKIIREQNGHREMGILNINDGSKIYDSPYYYLQQNDIVYVELNDRKIANTDQSTLRNISIGLGIISTLALIVTTISNF